MKLRALIFDVDGTLADTEEAHRQAFNAAFLAHSLPWEWSPELYGELLAVTGGKERIGKYLESLPLSRPEKESLRRLVPLVHSTKTQRFAEFAEMGNVPLRPGIARLIAEARAAGLPLAIASTTTPANVNALLTRTLGLGALGWFGAIASLSPASRASPISRATPGRKCARPSAISSLKSRVFSRWIAGTSWRSRTRSDSATLSEST